MHARGPSKSALKKGWTWGNDQLKKGSAKSVDIRNANRKYRAAGGILIYSISTRVKYTSPIKQPHLSVAKKKQNSRKATTIFAATAPSNSIVAHVNGSAGHSNTPLLHSCCEP